MSVKVMAVNKSVGGAEHEAVVLTCESAVAVYSVEVLTTQTVMRIDGVEVSDGGFPIKASTRSLMHAYYNVNDMAENYLQTSDAVLKASLLINMQRAIDSSL